jgi:cation diffusion facilitator family transporter
MHSHSIDDFRHAHMFLGEAHERNERKVWIVIAICAAMMALEIAGGFWFGSVALIADGLHMSSAGALLIAALPHLCAASRHSRLTFGTGSWEISRLLPAIVLAMIALLIGYESVGRLLRPVPIAFNEAIPIAALGLCVNLLTAYLLRDEHDHQHHEHHHDDHAHVGGYHRDHNLRAAFVHVMADAAVSVLVIAGLLAARQLGWLWMDPLMGLVATIVILDWSWSLVQSAGAVLLDASPDGALAPTIRSRLETERSHSGSSSLAPWSRSHRCNHFACLDHPQSPAAYKKRLQTARTVARDGRAEPCPGPQGTAPSP